MDSPEPRRTFAELLQLFRAGDPEATAELLRRYNPVIRNVVRERLPQRMRGEFESLDFVQEVWTAVCGGPGRDAHFHTADGLREYLVQIAVSRVVDAFRRRSSMRAFVGRPNLPLEVAIFTIGTDPTPSQWAMADERWETIAATLPQSHVVVVDRLRQGFSQKEIAEQTGVSVRTISRILQRVQRQCEEVPA